MVTTTRKMKSTGGVAGNRNSRKEHALHGVLPLLRQHLWSATCGSHQTCNQRSIWKRVQLPCSHRWYQVPSRGFSNRKECEERTLTLIILNSSLLAPKSGELGRSCWILSNLQKAPALSTVATEHQDTDGPFSGSHCSLLVKVSTLEKVQANNFPSTGS